MLFCEVFWIKRLIGHWQGLIDVLCALHLDQDVLCCDMVRQVPSSIRQCRNDNQLETQSYVVFSAYPIIFAACDYKARNAKCSWTIKRNENGNDREEKHSKKKPSNQTKTKKSINRGRLTSPINTVKWSKDGSTWQKCHEVKILQPPDWGYLLPPRKENFHY